MLQHQPRMSRHEHSLSLSSGQQLQNSSSTAFLVCDTYATNYIPHGSRCPQPPVCKQQVISQESFESPVRKPKTQVLTVKTSIGPRVVSREGVYVSLGEFSAMKIKQK